MLDFLVQNRQRQIVGPVILHIRMQSLLDSFSNGRAPGARYQQKAFNFFALHLRRAFFLSLRSICARLVIMVGIRLDQRVVQLGLVESREKAQRLILAGCVNVDGRVDTKSSHPVPETAVIVLAESERFVGRGGEKLEEAFRRFSLDVKGLIGLDVGASTGGFTDCLLQHGVARVYAVDVGKGQLHWKLRMDPRVIVMDGVNAEISCSGRPARDSRFCDDRRIVHLLDEDFARCYTGSCERRAHDFVDQTSVRGWTRAGGEGRCGA